MDSRSIVKLEGLKGDIVPTSEFVSFILTGPIDVVRQAARDAVFGLPALCDHPKAIVVEHQSEIERMEKRASSSDSSAKIVIKVIDYDQCEVIQTLFHYWEKLGLTVPDYSRRINSAEDLQIKLDSASSAPNESNSQQPSLSVYAYLDAIRRSMPHDGLFIRDYPRPVNRCFWSTQDLVSHLQFAARVDARIDERMTHGFHPSADVSSSSASVPVSENGSDDQQRIMQHILTGRQWSKIVHMICSHPFFTGDMEKAKELVGSYVENYIQLKKENHEYDVHEDPEYDVHADPAKFFEYIPPDYMDEFIAIAESEFVKRQPRKPEDLQPACMLL